MAAAAENNAAAHHYSSDIVALGACLSPPACRALRHASHCHRPDGRCGNSKTRQNTTLLCKQQLKHILLICLYRQPCHRSHDCTVLIWSACSLQLALPFLCSASSRMWLKVWRYSGFHCCAVINLICSIGTHAITHIGAWQNQVFVQMAIRAWGAIPSCSTRCL